MLITSAIRAQEIKIDSLKKELALHTKKDTVKVNLLIELSKSYSTADINRSNEKAQEAYDLAKALNYKKGTANSLLRLSNNALRNSERDNAENYTLKAFEICKELKDPDCIYASYTSLGKIAYLNGKFDKATDFYKKALELSIKNGDSLVQAKMYNHIGTSRYRKGNFDEAIDLFKKAADISEQLGEEKLNLDILNNIGAICLNQGRYTEALTYFNKCLSIHITNDEKEDIAVSSYNISAVYYELKQYDKTLDHLDIALNIYRELDDKKQISRTLINKGAVYADLKDFENALSYMTKSINLSKEINDKTELSGGNFQLGDLYFLMDQPKNALKHYKACLEISESIEDKIYSCHAHIGLAKTYASLKNYSNALIHAENGKKIANELELLPQQILVYKTLATIYSAKGNYKKALESHQQFKLLNDSLFNKENIEKIAQLEYEYKYRQALDSASIRELKLTKTVMSTSQDLAKTKQNYLWAVIGILVISILSGSLVFYQKYKNVKVKNQNIITEQRLLRSQMTPHFIFNSLSVLQGMILNKEEKKSITYLSKFSKLLRLVLENSRDKIVPLIQELDAIDNYMILQNMDANSPYDYSLVVDENININLFLVPPMLIQPFIENAIEHAFSINQEHREIEVHLSFNNQKLSCTITDNGVGIDAMLQKTNTKKKSLATTITSERLNLLSKDFNMPGSVFVEDRKKYNEQGTKVTLIIPYKIIKNS
ncbi:tetratricopeptide repeat protein [Pseudozobellia thermophila]|uniref:tetratricopeptide repeat protein n=1 Tax=Pseudozobellia thermophila TaxID=192903 RepID=UPI0014800694|nr:tetratricopeptide repeat protein [Pseudozobellia thermophila]